MLSAASALPSQGKLDHEGRFYYKSSMSVKSKPYVYWYRCKGVKMPDESWTCSKMAIHRNSFPGGTIFCSGGLKRTFHDDGDVIEKNGEHICGEAKFVDLTGASGEPARKVARRAEASPGVSSSSSSSSSTEVLATVNGPEGEVILQVPLTANFGLGAGITDTRIPFMICGLPPACLRRDLIEDVRKDLHACTKWESISGGRRAGKIERRFLPSLETDASLAWLLEKVKIVMEPYIALLHTLYPNIAFFKFGAILSEPGAESQYEGHGERVHGDFPDCSFRPPGERPVSMLVALDRFRFLYLADPRDPDSKLIQALVESAHAAIFTSSCLHSGGANPEEYPCVRLFVYGVAHEEDFPRNRIWISGHTKDGETRVGPSESVQSFTTPADKRKTVVTKYGRQCHTADAYTGVEPKPPTV